MAVFITGGGVKQGIITPVSFISATGTQFIKTGVIPDQNLSVEVKYQTETTKGTIFGTDQGYKVQSFCVFTSVVSYLTDSSVQTLYGSSDHIVKMQKNQFYFDGTLKAAFSTGTFTTPLDIYLFANNRRGVNSEPISGKIYYCKMWSGDDLIKDLIPVVDANGQFCMQDNLSGDLFYNAGTGEFAGG